jgi:uncharacterized lipoprotein YajG
LEADVKDTLAVVTLLAALAMLAGCRSNESSGQTGAARDDRRPPSAAPSTTKNAQRADRGPATSGRPHEKDSDLFEEMK